MKRFAWIEEKGLVVSPRFGKLKLVPADLNSALVQGEAQTLWLSGTHRRVASRVDNKILTGLDCETLDEIATSVDDLVALLQRVEGYQRSPVTHTRAESST